MGTLARNGLITLSQAESQRTFQQALQKVCFHHRIIIIIIVIIIIIIIIIIIMIIIIVIIIIIIIIIIILLLNDSIKVKHYANNTQYSEKYSIMDVCQGCLL